MMTVEELKKHCKKMLSLNLDPKLKAEHYLILKIIKENEELRKVVNNVC